MAERFGSFNVDHEKLSRGIYISRVQDVDNGYIYTVDIRTRIPYRDKAMSDVVMHSIEHLMATRIEQQCQADIKKVYFGPMGCATGFYALFYVPKQYMEQAPGFYKRAMLTHIYNASDICTEIPFNSKLECGNCLTLADTPKEIEQVNSMLTIIRTLAKLCLDNGDFDTYPYIEE